MATSISLDGVPFADTDFAGLGHTDPVTVDGTTYPRFQALWVAGLNEIDARVAGVAGKILAGSTTALTPGAGEKVFTIEADKGFEAGHVVLAYSEADPTGTFMAGTVAGYAGTTLTVTVPAVADWYRGAEASDWVIVPGGVPGAKGDTGSFLDLSGQVPVTSPADADLLGIADADDGFQTKKITIANMRQALGAAGGGVNHTLGSAVVLTSSSAKLHRNQSGGLISFTLPDATTMALDIASFGFVGGNAACRVLDHGGNLLQTVPVGATAIASLYDNGTADGGWTFTADSTEIIIPAGAPTGDFQIVDGFSGNAAYDSTTASVMARAPSAPAMDTMAPGQAIKVDNVGGTVYAQVILGTDASPPVLTAGAEIALQTGVGNGRPDVVYLADNRTVAACDGDVFLLTSDAAGTLTVVDSETGLLDGTNGYDCALTRLDANRAFLLTRTGAGSGQIVLVDTTGDTIAITLLRTISMAYRWNDIEYDPARRQLGVAYFEGNNNRVYGALFHWTGSALTPLGDPIDLTDGTDTITGKPCIVPQKGQRAQWLVLCYNSSHNTLGKFAFDHEYKAGRLLRWWTAYYNFTTGSAPYQVGFNWSWLDTPGGRSYGLFAGNARGNTLIGSPIDQNGDNYADTWAAEYADIAPVAPGHHASVAAQIRPTWWVVLDGGSTDVAIVQRDSMDNFVTTPGHVYNAGNVVDECAVADRTEPGTFVFIRSNQTYIVKSNDFTRPAAMPTGIGINSQNYFDTQNGILFRTFSNENATQDPGTGNQRTGCRLHMWRVRDFGVVPGGSYNQLFLMPDTSNTHYTAGARAPVKLQDNGDGTSRWMYCFMHNALNDPLETVLFDLSDTTMEITNVVIDDTGTPFSQTYSLSSPLSEIFRIGGNKFLMAAGNNTAATTLGLFDNSGGPLSVESDIRIDVSLATDLHFVGLDANYTAVAARRYGNTTYGPRIRLIRHDGGPIANAANFDVPYGSSSNQSHYMSCFQRLEELSPGIFRFGMIQTHNGNNHAAVYTEFLVDTLAERISVYRPPEESSIFTELHQAIGFAGRVHFATSTDGGAMFSFTSGETRGLQSDGNGGHGFGEYLIGKRTV